MARVIPSVWKQASAIGSFLRELETPKMNRPDFTRRLHGQLSSLERPHKSAESNVRKGLVLGRVSAS